MAVHRAGGDKVEIEQQALATTKYPGKAVGQAKTFGNGSDDFTHLPNYSWWVDQLQLCRIGLPGSADMSGALDTPNGCCQWL